MEAVVNKECLPLPPAQEWAVLPDALRVAALSKEPPTVRHAKGDLRKGGRSEGLIHDERAAGFEQLLTM